MLEGLEADAASYHVTSCQVLCQMNDDEFQSRSLGRCSKQSHFAHSLSVTVIV